MRISDSIKCTALSLFLAAGTAQTAMAQGSTPSTVIFKDGARLYQACTSRDSDTLEQCDWYIMGVYDALTFQGDVRKAVRSVCLPAETTIRQLRDTVVAYLQANNRRYSAVSLVSNSLELRFPCQR